MYFVLLTNAKQWFFGEKKACRGWKSNYSAIIVVKYNIPNSGGLWSENIWFHELAHIYQYICPWLDLLFHLNEHNYFLLFFFTFSISNFPVFIGADYLMMMCIPIVRQIALFNVSYVVALQQGDKRTPHECIEPSRFLNIECVQLFSMFRILWLNARTNLVHAHSASGPIHVKPPT